MGRAVSRRAFRKAKISRAAELGMKKGLRIAELSAIIVCAALGIASSAQAQGQTSTASDRKENTMSFHAKGSFVPTLTPQPPDDKAAGSTLARLSIAKNWHGDLEATSEGQMITATTEVKGSAAYVAIERVTGSLGGRHGSFVLQHMGTLERGAPHLSVTAVPDSGTGELAGIAISNFTLNIAPDGKHSYEFDYTLPKQK